MGGMQLSEGTNPMRPSRTLLAATALVLGALTAPAAAQAGNAWVSFTKVPAKLAVAPAALSDSGTQVSFCTADLDKNGWDDVVAVRKPQASALGTRTEFLLMNTNGVLTDRTAQYATASDVSGDSGFNTPTSSYECAIGDVNGDTWPDVVICAGLNDGQHKTISHPRVYINRGATAVGRWKGLRYEAARIPQLLTVGGLAVAPRFARVALGDVTGDGAPDLYFTDFDTTETGITEPATADLNDRLLVNDGNGFFTDQSMSHLTTMQLQSSFGSDVQIVDLNGDGKQDIVKVSLISVPFFVRALYNNPANVGDFATLGVSDFGTAAPEGVFIGNLNNDGLVDAALTDDGSDKFRFGTGFDGLDKVIWGPSKNYSFVSGGDDGFAQHISMQDLDNDGWNDVLTTDVDIDLAGCNRRAHIYHNTGSVPGDLNVVIKEEAEIASGGTGAGWKGVVGMAAADLKGSYDFGFGDFDKDGDLDVLLGTCTGTNYWQNNTLSALTQSGTDLGFGSGGSLVVGVSGGDLTVDGSSAVLRVTGAAPHAALGLALGLSAQATPFHGGFLVPMPVLALIGGLQADATGTFTLPLAGGAGAPARLIVQALSGPATALELSNALEVELGF